MEVYKAYGKVVYKGYKPWDTCSSECDADYLAKRRNNKDQIRRRSNCQLDKLTQEEQQILRDFAVHNGRRWKSILIDCWTTGQGGPCADEVQCVLQRVRNCIGPSRLADIRF